MQHEKVYVNNKRSDLNETRQINVDNGKTSRNVEKSNRSTPQTEVLSTVIITKRSELRNSLFPCNYSIM